MKYSANIPYIDPEDKNSIYERKRKLIENILEQQFNNGDRNKIVVDSILGQIINWLSEENKNKPPIFLIYALTELMQNPVDKTIACIVRILNSGEEKQKAISILEALIPEVGISQSHKCRLILCNIYIEIGKYTEAQNLCTLGKIFIEIYNDINNTSVRPTPRLGDLIDEETNITIPTSKYSIDEIELIKEYDLKLEQITNLKMGIFNFSKSKNDKPQIFQIAIDGLNLFEENYMSLNNQGKYEVLILNSYIVIKICRTNNYRNLTRVEDNVFNSLFYLAEEFKIPFKGEALVNFINERIAVYAEELLKLFANENYILGKFHSAFVLNPLAKEIEISFDLEEVMKCNASLSLVINSVTQKTLNFINNN